MELKKRTTAIPHETVLTTGARDRSATATATSAQTPTSPASRMFRSQVSHRYAAPATTIIIMVPADGAIPHPVHPIFTSQTAILTTVAKTIQPRYIQKGHHNNTTVSGSASVISIPV